MSVYNTVEVPRIKLNLINLFTVGGPCRLVFYSWLSARLGKNEEFDDVYEYCGQFTSEKPSWKSLLCNLQLLH